MSSVPIDQGINREEEEGELCISLLLSVFVYPILSVSTILNVFHNMFDKRHDKLLFRLLYRLNSMQTNELHNPLWLCVPLIHEYQKDW